MDRRHFICSTAGMPLGGSSAPKSLVAERSSNRDDDNLKHRTERGAGTIVQDGFELLANLPCGTKGQTVAEASEARPVGKSTDAAREIG